MNKVKFFWSYPLNVDIDTERDVEIYFDRFIDTPVPHGGIRIIVLQEPFNREVFEQIKRNQDNYTHVLTYMDDILRAVPKSRLFMGTNSWVRGHVPQQKKFCVSILVGGKVNGAMPGYALRHDLWRAQDQITIPKDFYLSGECKWPDADYTRHKTIEGSIVPNSKAPLFDSQFHIAIENTSIPNMFTEKLIDCFQTKTVPIYFGAPNIGDTFNACGIIAVKNLQEIINACNQITPDTYERLLPLVEDNYITSCKYCVYDEQIKNIITQILNEEG